MSPQDRYILSSWPCVRCNLVVNLISLLMLSFLQTYERSCIQKWLDSGHRTCPKTQQNLSHTAVTPNFVLKSLITQWCEANGIEPPKKSGSCRERRSGSRHDCDRATIKSLLEKLERGNQEERRAVASEIQLLAR